MQKMKAVRGLPPGDFVALITEQTNKQTKQTHEQNKCASKQTNKQNKQINKLTNKQKGAATSSTSGGFVVALITPLPPPVAGADCLISHTGLRKAEKFAPQGCKKLKILHQS